MRAKFVQNCWELIRSLVRIHENWRYLIHIHIHVHVHENKNNIFILRILTLIIMLVFLLLLLVVLLLLTALLLVLRFLLLLLRLVSKDRADGWSCCALSSRSRGC